MALYYKDKGQTLYQALKAFTMNTVLAEKLISLKCPENRGKRDVMKLQI